MMRDAFKFRTANHKLPIETGRWDGTLLEHRNCNLCQKDEIGSERHYLLTCDYFSNLRLKYLCNIISGESEYEYKKLLQSSTKLARFTSYIMSKFDT